MPVVLSAPDAAAGVVAALALEDALAARAADSALAVAVSYVLAARRLLELRCRVEGVPEGSAPAHFAGVARLVLRQGVTPVSGRMFEQHEELAAAAALAGRPASGRGC
ncbi:unnamed protein product [Prorocentrum cordatum]|uniref:Uncharacterized protein n=1 Tax=Prorocentrum cordatum TaxID=2364126 RepID=A0ABN9WNF8_9DINO|nr:unnamed protein product [Polarella glacialis]